MSADPPRARLLTLAAACGASLYALWIRPQPLIWGATGDETGRAYPGDDFVPDADGGATMATTLPAPPERVWPWLVQMGGDRGGWYRPCRPLALDQEPDRQWPDRDRFARARCHRARSFDRLVK